MKITHGIRAETFLSYFVVKNISQKECVDRKFFTHPYFTEKGSEQSVFQQTGLSSLINRRFTMGATISWLTEMEQALDRAKTENKAILLDFFNPN